jgi:hypothetical protein
MLPFYLSFLKVEDLRWEIMASNIDLIAPLSYATCRACLAHATLYNALGAVEWASSFPDAKVALSPCSYPFEGAAEVEIAFRKKIFLRHGIEPIIAEPMVNSIDEAEKIRDKLQSLAIKPKNILLLTGEMHSRAARIIWCKTFPDAYVFVRCETPCELEVQDDHPTPDQQRMGTWMRQSVKRYVAVRTLPLSLLRKIRHRAAHE